MYEFSQKHCVHPWRPLATIIWFLTWQGECLLSLYNVILKYKLIFFDLLSRDISHEKLLSRFLKLFTSFLLKSKVVMLLFACSLLGSGTPSSCGHGNHACPKFSCYCPVLPFLICKCQVQQSTFSCWLLNYLCQEAVLSAVKKPGFFFTPAVMSSQQCQIS